MKKIFTLLMVASMFSLVACGPSEEESAAAEAEAAAAVEELFDGLEEEIDAATEEVAEVELAEHVCGDKCTEEACSFACEKKDMNVLTLVMQMKKESMNMQKEKSTITHK